MSRDESARIACIIKFPKIGVVATKGVGHVPHLGPVKSRNVTCVSVPRKYFYTYSSFIWGRNNSLD